MSATHKVQVNVGSLAEMGKRFSKAWNQAAAGEQVDETNVTFLDVQTMLDTLSPVALICYAMFANMAPAMSGNWHLRWHVITKTYIRMLRFWRQPVC